jgi:hypothetical protein
MESSFWSWVLYVHPMALSWLKCRGEMSWVVRWVGVCVCPDLAGHEDNGRALASLHALVVLQCVLGCIVRGVTAVWPDML